MEAVKKYGNSRENLIPVMQHVVYKKVWLNEDVMKEIAEAFNLSAAEVYGVASFYSFLNTEACGKYIIRLCRTISCDMSGKAAIMEALKKQLRVDIGETTPDRMFTLLETNCMGWCHKGPAMLVNDVVYTELTPDKAVDIIHEYMEKEKQ